jgi:hypothetical protein
MDETDLPRSSDPGPDDPLDVAIARLREQLATLDRIEQSISVPGAEHPQAQPNGGLTRPSETELRQAPQAAGDYLGAGAGVQPAPNVASAPYRTQPQARGIGPATYGQPPQPPDLLDEEGVADGAPPRKRGFVRARVLAPLGILLVVGAAAVVVEATLPPKAAPPPATTYRINQTVAIPAAAHLTTDSALATDGNHPMDNTPLWGIDRIGPLLYARELDFDQPNHVTVNRFIIDAGNKASGRVWFAVSQWLSPGPEYLFMVRQRKTDMSVIAYQPDIAQLSNSDVDSLGSMIPGGHRNAPQKTTTTTTTASGTSRTGTRVTRTGTVSTQAATDPLARLTPANPQLELSAPVPPPPPGASRSVFVTTYSGNLPDLVVVDYGIPNERASIVVFSGESGFKTKILDRKLPVASINPKSWVISFGQVEPNKNGAPDLILVARDGRSGYTEVHDLLGGADYDAWGFHATTSLPPDLPHSFRFVLGSSLGAPALYGVDMRTGHPHRILVMRLISPPTRS